MLQFFSCRPDVLLMQYSYHILFTHNLCSLSRNTKFCCRPCHTHICGSLCNIVRSFVVVLVKPNQNVVSALYISFIHLCNKQITRCCRSFCNKCFLSLIFCLPRLASRKWFLHLIISLLSSSMIVFTTVHISNERDGQSRGDGVLHAWDDCCVQLSPSGGEGEGGDGGQGWW